MKFEYNGHLEENKRIIKVANEIITYYSEIDFDTAKIIASLEEPITTLSNDIMRFKRLYNILFVTQNNRKIFSKVFIDIKKLYVDSISKIKTNYLISSMMDELIKYINYERNDFPIISEFY